MPCFFAFLAASAFYNSWSRVFHPYPLYDGPVRCFSVPRYQSPLPKQSREREDSTAGAGMPGCWVSFKTQRCHLIGDFMATGDYQFYWTVMYRGISAQNTSAELSAKTTARHAIRMPWKFLFFGSPWLVHCYFSRHHAYKYMKRSCCWDSRSYFACHCETNNIT